MASSLAASYSYGAVANKALVLGAATIGGVMIYSGLAGVSVMDVLAGNASLAGADPKGGKGLTAAEANAQSRGARELLQGGGSISGRTPKEIIDQEVIPLAQGRGMPGITPESVARANARHGRTITGGTSDHQGPPEKRWAADMSNGEHPTPQMDQLTQDLAHKFGLKWDGSGAVSKTITIGGVRYRVQMIYRSYIGGDHFNHVHFGIERV